MTILFTSTREALYNSCINASDKKETSLDLEMVDGDPRAENVIIHPHQVRHLGLDHHSHWARVLESSYTQVRLFDDVMSLGPLALPWLSQPLCLNQRKMSYFISFFFPYWSTEILIELTSLNNDSMCMFWIKVWDWATQNKHFN